MIALGPAQTPMRSFAPEFGLILPPPNTPLISHFPKRAGARTVVPITVPPSVSSALPILSRETEGKEILFSGIPLALAAGTNPQLVPILHAPAQSFATDTTADNEADVLVEASERGGEGLWAGAGHAVLAGFQTKAGGRVVWAGGVDMFSDAFAGAGAKKKQAQASGGNENGNTLLALDVAAWAFQERGMLRIEGVSHHRVGETHARETYTTNDVVVRTHFQLLPARGVKIITKNPFLLPEIGLLPQRNAFRPSIPTLGLPLRC
jgi:oligosaccharyltransferase complex subunit beta